MIIVSIVVLSSITSFGIEKIKTKKTNPATADNLDIWAEKINAGFSQIDTNTVELATKLTSGADATLGTVIVSNLTVVGSGNVEVVTKKNQPNGYAGLDANGKINADMVETITVVFAGGPAVDSH